jgi:hypothetical protein
MRHAHWVDLVTMIPLGRSHTVLAWKGTVHHIGRGTSGRSWKRSSLESLLSWEPPTVVRRALGPQLAGLHSWLLLSLLDGQQLDRQTSQGDRWVETRVWTGLETEIGLSSLRQRSAQNRLRNVLETLSGRTSLIDRAVENRLNSARESVFGRISELDRRFRMRLNIRLDNHVVRIMLMNGRVDLRRRTDLEGRGGVTSLGDSRVLNQRGDGVGSWMDRSSLWHSGLKNRRGQIVELRIDRPVIISLRSLGDALLSKDFRKQPRQELAGHNDKRRVKLLVLVKGDTGITVADDLGIIVADDLGITVADDMGITVGVADATPNLVVTITHRVR